MAGSLRQRNLVAEGSNKFGSHLAEATATVAADTVAAVADAVEPASDRIEIRWVQPSIAGQS